MRLRPTAHHQLYGIGFAETPGPHPRDDEPGQCNLVKGRSLLADWDPASAALPVGVEEWLEEQVAEDERALTLLAHLERLALDIAMRAAPRRTAVLAEWAALTDSGRSAGPRSLVDTPMSVSEEEAYRRIARDFNTTPKEAERITEKVQGILFRNGWLGTPAQEIRRASDWQGESR